ncbi:MAG: hypothetical protein NC826_06125, partial [Candidatus Omnitrophica bacterium]|nr:hypothetical protein [Candidatus Omnitrophota bacterium]
GKVILPVVIESLLIGGVFVCGISWFLSFAFALPWSLAPPLAGVIFLGIWLALHTIHLQQKRLTIKIQSLNSSIFQIVIFGFIIIALTFIFAISPLSSLFLTLIALILPHIGVNYIGGVNCSQKVKIEFFYLGNISPQEKGVIYRKIREVILSKNGGIPRTLILASPPVQIDIHPPRLDSDPYRVIIVKFPLDQLYNLAQERDGILTRAVIQSEEGRGGEIPFDLGSFRVTPEESGIFFWFCNYFISLLLSLAGKDPVTANILYRATKILKKELERFPSSYFSELTKLGALVGYIEQSYPGLNLERVLAPWQMIDLLEEVYNNSGIRDKRVEEFISSLREKLLSLWKRFQEEVAYNRFFTLFCNVNPLLAEEAPRITPWGVRFVCSLRKLSAGIEEANLDVAELAKILGCSANKEEVRKAILDYAQRNPHCLYLVGNFLWSKPWGEPYTTVDIGGRMRGSENLREGWVVPFLPSSYNYNERRWEWVIACEVSSVLQEPKHVHYKFLLLIEGNGAFYNLYFPDLSVLSRTEGVGNSVVIVGRSEEFNRIAQERRNKGGITLQVNLELLKVAPGENSLQRLIRMLPTLRSWGISRIMLGPGTLCRGSLPWNSPYAPAFLVFEPYYGDLKDFRELCKQASLCGIEIIYDFVGGHTDPYFLPFPKETYLYVLEGKEILPVNVWGSRRLNDQLPDTILCLLWWLRALGFPSIRADQAGTISSWLFMELRNRGVRIIAEWEDPVVQLPFDELYYEEPFNLMQQEEISFGDLEERVSARLGVIHPPKGLLLVWNNHDKSSCFGGPLAFVKNTNTSQQISRIKALFMAVVILYLLYMDRVSLMLYYPDLFGHLGRICFMFKPHSPLVYADGELGQFVQHVLSIIGEEGDIERRIKRIETGNPFVAAILLEGDSKRILLLSNLSFTPININIYIDGQSFDLTLSGYETRIDFLPPFEEDLTVISFDWSAFRLLCKFDPEFFGYFRKLIERKDVRVVFNARGVDEKGVVRFLREKIGRDFNPQDVISSLTREQPAGQSKRSKAMALREWMEENAFIRRVRRVIHFDDEEREFYDFLEVFHPLSIRVKTVLVLPSREMAGRSEEIYEDGDIVTRRYPQEDEVSRDLDRDGLPRACWSQDACLTLENILSTFSTKPTLGNLSQFGLVVTTVISYMLSILFLGIFIYILGIKLPYYLTYLQNGINIWVCILFAFLVGIFFLGLVKTSFVLTKMVRWADEIIRRGSGRDYEQDFRINPYLKAKVESFAERIGIEIKYMSSEKIFQFGRGVLFHASGRTLYVNQGVISGVTAKTQQLVAADIQREQREAELLALALAHEGEHFGSICQLFDGLYSGLGEIPAYLKIFQINFISLFKKLIKGIRVILALLTLIVFILPLAFIFSSTTHKDDFAFNQSIMELAQSKRIEASLIPIKGLSCIHVKDKEAMSRLAVEIFLYIIEKAKERRQKRPIYYNGRLIEAVFLLPTGATQERWYELLSELINSLRLSLAGVIGLHLDEYYDGIDYFDYVYRRHLCGCLYRLNVPKEYWPRIYIIRGISYRDPQEIKDRYREYLQLHNTQISEEELDRLVELYQKFTLPVSEYASLIERLDGIDGVFLGIGVEGHVAFIEHIGRLALFILSTFYRTNPRLFQNRFIGKILSVFTELRIGEVCLSPSTIVANDPDDKMRARGIDRAYSVSIREIFLGRYIVLLASGAKKKEALFHTLLGRIGETTASVLRLAAGHVLVIADAGALEKVILEINSSSGVSFSTGTWPIFQSLYHQATDRFGSLLGKVILPVVIES